MYCANCGQELQPNAGVCLNCGYQQGIGSSFCPNCGAPIIPGAAICTNCGYNLMGYQRQPAASDKNRIVAGVLAVLFGAIGIHNFYLGFTKKGLTQLLISLIGGAFTCGLAAIAVEIWAFVEGIQLLINKESYDADGRLLQG